MSELELDPEFISLARAGLKLEKSQYRRVSKLLNQAMKAGCRDMNYLEHLCDGIYDAMFGFSGKGELLLRKVIRYVASFDKVKADQWMESLIEDLGYKYNVVYAAAHVARKWLGEEKYKVHVIPYASHCHHWKMKTIALLSKLPIWAGHSIEDSVAEVKALVKTWDEDKQNRDWIDEYLDDIDNYPPKRFKKLTKQEWEEITETAKVLSPKATTTVEDFYQSIKSNLLALRVREAEINSLKYRLEKCCVPSEYRDYYQRVLFEFEYVWEFIKPLLNEKNI